MMLASALWLLVLPASPPQSAAVDGPVGLGWQSRVDALVATDEVWRDVVIVGDTAYAAGVSGSNDLGLIVVAADVSGVAELGDQDVLWSQRFDGIPGLGDGAAVVRATPTRVVVGGFSDTSGLPGHQGIVLGIDPADGGVLWTRAVGPAALPFSFVRTEVVDMEINAAGTVVYALAHTTREDYDAESVPVTDRLLALDVADGSVLWDVATTGLHRARGLALSPDGSRLVAVGAKMTSIPFGGVGYGFTALCRSSVDGGPVWARDLLTNIPFVLDGEPGAHDVAFAPCGLKVVVVGNAAALQAFALHSSNGATLWSAGQSGLGLQRLRIADAARMYAVGAKVQTARTLAFDLADGHLAWDRSGIGARAATALAVEGSSGHLAAAFRDGPVAGAGQWNIEVRDPVDGDLEWVSTLGSGDGARDGVLGLAIHCATGRLIAAGLRYDAAERAEAVLAAYTLADGSPLGSVAVGHHQPADQRVTAMKASSDGAVLYAAGDRGTLYVDGGPPVVDTVGGYVTAMRADDGTVLWSTPLHAPPAGPYRLDALAVGAGGTRVFASGQYDAERAFVAALDALTGAVLFEVPIDNHAGGYDRAHDVVALAGCDVVVVATASVGAIGVVALAAQSGDVLWSAIEAPADEAHPPGLLAAPDGSRVYLVGSTFVSGGGKGNLAAVAYDTQDGAVLWSEEYDWSGQAEWWDFDHAKDAALRADGERLFIFGHTAPDNSFTQTASVAVCIDTALGDALWYRVSPPEPGEGIAPMRMALAPNGTRLYGLSTVWRDFGLGEFDLVVEALDAANGDVLWRSQFFTGYIEQFNGNAIAVSPGGTAVLIAAAAGGPQPDSDGLTAAFDAATGAVIWSVLQPGAGPLREDTQRLWFAPDGRRALVASQNSLDPAHRDLLVQELQLPSLTGAPQMLSVGAGGMQSFALSGGVELAGHFALLVGSISGTQPGLPLGPGLTVPLNFDPYTQFLVANPNSAVLPGSLALLPQTGASAAAWVMPAGAPPQLVGLELHHAWVALAPAAVVFASNPVPLLLGP